MAWRRCSEFPEFLQDTFWEALLSGDVMEAASGEAFQVVRLGRQEGDLDLWFLTRPCPTSQGDR